MSQEAHTHRLGLGISVSLVAYLFFAAASSLVWTFQGRFPTIQIIFIQNFVSLLCILPYSIRHGFEHLRSDNIPIHLIRDLFGVSSYFLFFLAIRQLDLVNATILNYTAPFFVPFVMLIWLKQKITLSVWWSILVGFIGVAIILNPTREIFSIGILTGIGAALCSAIAAGALSILNLRKEPLGRTLFYYFTVGTALSLPLAEYYWVAPTPTEWLSVIAIGVATAIGQLLLTYAFKHGTAAYLSPLGYSTVIYNAMSSFWLFGKPLTLNTFAGAILIIAGGSVSYILRKKPHNVRETFENDPPKT